MSGTFAYIAVFAVLAAVVNGLGIFAIARHREWAERNHTYFMCFAAGILVSTPLLLALPQAAEKSSHAGLLALLGFLFMFFSNRVIKHFTKEEGLCFGMTAAEGIAIHSVIDGVIYTVTFGVSIVTGLLAATGLVIHEFAEGVITYLLLLRGGMKQSRVVFYAFLIAALTTPVGAFVAYPFVSRMSESVLGLMLGFVSGVLIYVSASHLLPEARQSDKPHSSLVFLLGVALAVFIVIAKG